MKLVNSKIAPRPGCIVARIAFWAAPAIRAAGYALHCRRGDIYEVPAATVDFITRVGEAKLGQDWRAHLDRPGKVSGFSVYSARRQCYLQLRGYHGLRLVSEMRAAGDSFGVEFAANGRRARLAEQRRQQRDEALLAAEGVRVLDAIDWYEKHRIAEYVAAGQTDLVRLCTWFHRDFIGTFGFRSAIVPRAEALEKVPGWQRFCEPATGSVGRDGGADHGCARIEEVLA